MGVQVVDFDTFQDGAAQMGSEATDPVGVRSGIVDPEPVASEMRGGRASETTPAAKGSVQGKSAKAAGASGKPEVSAAARDEIMRVLMPSSKLAPNENPQGFARSVKEVGTQLRLKAREARKPFYEEAYRAGADGIEDGAFAEMSQSPNFALAMRRAERAMSDPSLVAEIFTTGLDGPKGRTLEYWDMVRQSLDDMHANARSAGSPRAEEIDALRQQLRKKLNDKSPQYAAARGAAELFFNANDPFEAGTKFARGRYSLDGASQALAAMGGEEKKLFTEGFATAFVEDVRAAPDRAAALDRINGGETGRNRIRIALGAKADQLEAFLRLEGLMTKVKDADPTQAMADILVRGSTQTEMPVDRKVAEHIAGMLTSKNPDIFLNGLKQAAKPNVLEGLRQLGAGVAPDSDVAPDATSAGDDPVLSKARDAIARGADRTAVMKRLQDNGVSPKGLMS